MRCGDPWRVVSSGEYGRYLVATRDISPGELVLTDQALVWGPQHSATNLLCLERLSCLRLLSPGEYINPLFLCIRIGFSAERGWSGWLTNKWWTPGSMAGL